jgi:hypothetical protein
MNVTKLKKFEGHRVRYIRTKYGRAIGRTGWTGVLSSVDSYRGTIQYDEGTVQAYSDTAFIDPDKTLSLTESEMNGWSDGYIEILPETAEAHDPHDFFMVEGQKFYTLDSAVANARKLASKTTRPVYIMKPVSFYQKEEPPVKEVKL